MIGCEQFLVGMLAPTFHPFSLNCARKPATVRRRGVVPAFPYFLALLFFTYPVLTAQLSANCHTLYSLRFLNAKIKTPFGGERAIRD